ncbi:MAG: PH domain-containing protein [Verrucomicrobiota bacterium]
MTTAAPTPPHSTPEPQLIRPRKPSFIVPRVVSGFLISLVVSAAIRFGLSFLLPDLPHSVIAVAFFALSFGLVVLSAFVSYGEERYEFHATHLRCRRGGLASDRTTELDIRNITHVKIRLPWIRHKLFGIGHVLVESAGSAEPAAFRYIKNPETVYAELHDRMKLNGYSLEKKELLHEERPALIGVILESIGAILVAPFVIAGIAIQLVDLDSAETVVDNIDRWGSWATNLWVIAGMILAGAIFLFVLAVRFLDLRRRTYRVYDDVVIYEEGFLTRDNAFIPFENIADSETNQNLIDQILQLYDVQISCQGSGSEVKFRRLRRGPELSATIDDLVVRAREKSKPAREVESGTNSRIGQPEVANAGPASTETGPPNLPGHQAPPPIPLDQTWTGEFRIHPARLLIPSLILLPLLPIWIVVMIKGGVRLFATTFAVRPNSVRYAFKFLSTEEREFAYEKITGLVIKRNPLDRLFGTQTIEFWSIGSGKSLEFAHVKADQIDLAALKRQVGIPEPSPEPMEHPATFCLGALIRGRLPSLTVFLIVAVAMIVVAVLYPDIAIFFGIGLALILFAAVAGAVYSMMYHRRQRLVFHETHVEAEQGVLFRHHYLARFGNVKKAVLTRYPGGDIGKLQLFVAGEKEAMKGQAKKTQFQHSPHKPCSFTTDFLPGIEDKRRQVDDLLSGRSSVTSPTTPPEPFALVTEGSRSTANSVVKTILFGLLPPLTVALPFSLPYVIIATKRWNYRVESGRVVVTSGVLYRRQTSILVDRIDSIQNLQGPFNKVFKNGSIILMTAGSSQPDLMIANSPQYLELFQEIRSRSGMGR